MSDAAALYEILNESPSKWRGLPAETKLMMIEYCLDQIVAAGYTSLTIREFAELTPRWMLRYPDVFLGKYTNTGWLALLRKHGLRSPFQNQFSAPQPKKSKPKPKPRCECGAVADTELAIPIANNLLEYDRTQIVRWCAACVAEYHADNDWLRSRGKVLIAEVMPMA